MDRRASLVVAVAVALVALAVIARRRSHTPTSTVSVLPRSTRFTPRAFDEGLPTSGQWRNGFDVADLDGDGQLDLVHGPARKTPAAVPVIFLGDGHGRWRRDGDARFPPLAYDYGDVAAADLDGDGMIDLALGVHLRGLAAIASDGKGRFRSIGEGLALGPGAFSSRTIAIADWDGDGHPELIALSDGPRPVRVDEQSGALGVRVYGHDAHGFHALPLTLPAEAGSPFGDGLALGDVDGDGHLDLALAPRSLGRTAILFAHHGDRLETLDVGLPPRSLVTAVALGDVDGDRRAELIMGYGTVDAAGAWTSTVEVVWPSSSKRRVLEREPGHLETSAIALGDLDGDHARDVAVTHDDGSVHLYAGDGKGAFSRDGDVPTDATRAGCRGYRLRAIDLDHDGADELLGDFAGEVDRPAEGEASCVSGGSIHAWTFMHAR